MIFQLQKLVVDFITIHKNWGGYNMNLWDETVEKLQENGFTFDDVLFIYGEDFQISKEDFEKVAKTTVYYDGYGSQEIASDLTLLGNDFVMFREEYDGAEWWRIIFIGNRIPKKLVTGIDKLTGCWDTMQGILFSEKD